MTDHTAAPTRPSLPPELREKIDAYGNAVWDLAKERVGGGTVDAARAALDAALLPYVQDAERLNWCENVVSAITVCNEHGDETDIRCEMSRADQTFREFIDAARHTPGGQDNG